MAKTVQEQKPNKVIEILRKEYPFERILLGILGAFVLILGVYLVEGNLLTIKLTSWWIFNSELKRTIFAVLIILVGTIAFFMSIWAFFVPSFAEMKKVTWPKRKTILNHSARVFGFIIFLSLFFIVIDLGLLPLFGILIGN
jgi:preprotein translocase subunit SecE